MEQTELLIEKLASSYDQLLECEDELSSNTYDHIELWLKELTYELLLVKKSASELTLTLSFFFTTK